MRDSLLSTLYIGIFLFFLIKRIKIFVMNPQNFKDSDLLFVTTTVFSRWLDYQKQLIKKFFPGSEILIIDGRQNWPYAWFYWMEKIQDRTEKWFVHIDEDCFLTGREPLIELIQKAEDGDYTLAAVSDGFHHYRGANPVAINSFFMLGRMSHFQELDFKLEGIKFWHEDAGWRNSLGIIYDEYKHRKDFVYPHEKMGNGENCAYEQEPYYLILWMLKEAKRKFLYLYPHFDERFMSTNPRVSKTSEDLAIHMWYTRTWESPSPVHGIPNALRYYRVEDYLLKNLLNDI